MVYWSFKKPKGPEFSEFGIGVYNPDDVRYEARQVLFDTDRKLALFTHNLLLDRDGHLIGNTPDHQRIDLADGAHQTTLQVMQNLGTLINRQDSSFQRALELTKH